MLNIVNTDRPHLENQSLYNIFSKKLKGLVKVDNISSTPHYCSIISALA